MGRRFIMILAALAVVTNCVWAQDLALKGGTILTVTDGTIENGTLVIQNGKITAVGKNIKIPSGIKVIDVTGKKHYQIINARLRASSLVMPSSVASCTAVSYSFLERPEDSSFTSSARSQGLYWDMILT